MKKQWLIGVAMLALLASNALAADDATKNAPAPSSTSTVAEEHGMTLEEARKRAHEHADKLDKMTEQEWANHEKKRHEWKDKWQHMTPEEKAEHAKKHHEWMEKWDKMTPEEKAEHKKKHEERKEKKEKEDSTSAPPDSAKAPSTNTNP